MTIKYFCKDVNVQTTCDVGGSRNQDLDTTQGTGATVTSSNTQNVAFAEKLTFDIDVSGDGPITGTQSISLDVSGVTADLEYRFRARFIDDGTCIATDSTTYSSTFSTAGIRTHSASLTFDGFAERLRISVEVRKTGGHGNQSITVNVNDVDSFINAPFAPSVVRNRFHVIG